MTGVRTSETLKLQTAAKPNAPGYATPDGKSLRLFPDCAGKRGFAFGE
jgi:hypothetical protein